MLGSRAFILHPCFWRKVWESNPQERSGSDSFRDCLACPCPTFLEWRGRSDLNRERRGWNPLVWRLAYAPQDASGRSRTSNAHFRAAALQAAAEPFRPLMRENFFVPGDERFGDREKLTKAEGAAAESRTRTAAGIPERAAHLL